MSMLCLLNTENGNKSCNFLCIKNKIIDPNFQWIEFITDLLWFRLDQITEEKKTIYGMTYDSLFKYINRFFVKSTYRTWIFFWELYNFTFLVNSYSPSKTFSNPVYAYVHKYFSHHVGRNFFFQMSPTNGSETHGASLDFFFPSVLRQRWCMRAKKNCNLRVQWNDNRETTGSTVESRGWTQPIYFVFLISSRSILWTMQRTAF